MPTDPEPDDGLKEILEQMVRDGDLEAEGQGEARRYSMSEKGRSRAETLIGQTPEGRALLDKMRRSRN